MPVLVAAQTVLRASTRPQAVHLPRVTHVLQVSTAEPERHRVQTVRVEHIPLQMLVAALIVLPARIRM